MARLASMACAAAALMLAAPSQAQIDPMGALYGAAPGASRAPGQSSGRFGSLSIETAVGLSYKSANTAGFVSLAAIEMMPRTVAPLRPELKGYSERYVKLRPKVAVPVYGLGFVQGVKATASAMGRGSDITPRRTTVATRLVGFDDQMAGDLAREAHADLVRQLAAAGFDVVSQQEIDAAPRMQTLGRHAGPLPVNSGFAGWTVYPSRGGALIKGYALEQGMAQMAASGSLLALGHASKELDAVILLPRVLIGYIKMDSSGQSNWTANASVDAKLRFRIDPISRTDFVAGNERGGAMGGGWTCPGAGTDELFGILYQADDRSDSVGLHNTMASMGFGSLYRQSLVYDVEVAPRRYQALTRAAFQGYNAALVAELKRARGL